MRRTLRALPFITVWPRLTWPSPAMTTLPPLRTVMMVVRASFRDRVHPHFDRRPDSSRGVARSKLAGSWTYVGGETGDCNWPTPASNLPRCWLFRPSPDKEPDALKTSRTCRSRMRTSRAAPASVSRKTNETSSVRIRSISTAPAASKISTGVGFFDHMLDQLSRHSLIDMDHRDEGRPAHRRPPHRGGHRHRDRPGDRQGARRPARHHPLCLARPRHGRDADHGRGRRLGPAVPRLERRLLAHRRSAPSTPNWCANSSRRWPRMPASRCISQNIYGANNHHIAETCFKAVARVLRTATEIDPRQAGRVPSTKGTLV